MRASPLQIRAMIRAAHLDALAEGKSLLGKLTEVFRGVSAAKTEREILSVAGNGHSITFASRDDGGMSDVDRAEAWGFIMELYERAAESLEDGSTDHQVYRRMLDLVPTVTRLNADFSTLIK